MKRKLWLCVLVLLVGVLAACGGAAEELGDPVAESCAALSQLDEAVGEANLVNPAMDVLDITQVQTQLINSWKTLVSSAQRLDPAQMPPSLIAADKAFDEIPVATDTSTAVAAQSSVAAQAQIAQGVVDELTPLCAAQPAN